MMRALFKKKDPTKDPTSVGNILLAKNKITLQQLVDAVVAQETDPEFKGRKIGEILVDLYPQHVTDADIDDAIRDQIIARPGLGEDKDDAILEKVSREAAKAESTLLEAGNLLNKTVKI